PSNTIAHGAMILVAGVLLLTPGFFTDAVGFLLLMPPVRAALIARAALRVVASRIRVATFQTGPAGASGANSGMRAGRSGGTVIDGDYEYVDDGAGEQATHGARNDDRTPENDLGRGRGD
ncbi:MAG: FxsA family protein, partial [Pseudomonadota bacterium]